MLNASWYAHKIKKFRDSGHTDLGQQNEEIPMLYDDSKSAEICDSHLNVTRTLAGQIAVNDEMLKCLEKDIENLGQVLEPFMRESIADDDYNPFAGMKPVAENNSVVMKQLLTQLDAILVCRRKIDTIMSRVQL